MRIAFIATAPVPSRRANALQVMKVCDSLAALNHEVRLWVPGRGKSASQIDLKPQFGIRHPFLIEWIPAAVPFRHYDFCLRAVLSARRWKASLLYVRPLQAAALASQLGLPTLLDLHDRPHGRIGPRLLRAFAAGRGARRLVLTTDALRRWLGETYGLRLEPPFALVAPNGVDLERYEGLPEAAAARELLGWPQCFTASYTGQLYRGRGLDLLLELAVRNPEMRFVWAGGDPQAVEAWRRQLLTHGVANTRLLGFVPNEDLPMVHAASDVLLMPYESKVYLREGDLSTFYSPMKLFEYLAAGRVILSSDLPALREVLHEDNAILLPAEEVDAWDRSLNDVFAAPARSAPLALRARLDARQYGWVERSRKALEAIGP